MFELFPTKGSNNEQSMCFFVDQRDMDGLAFEMCDVLILATGQDWDR